MVQLSVSIGISWSDTQTGDSYVALKGAHTAAGTAQVAGGKRTMWFAETLSHALRHEISIESRLRDAIAAEAFQVVYQPIVYIAEGARPVGADALLRWPGQETPAASPGFPSRSPRRAPPRTSSNSRLPKGP